MATEQCEVCGTWNIKDQKCPECDEKKRIEAKIAAHKKLKKEKDKEK